MRSDRALPEGTVTFLFTDIEGSTRLLQELGDGYADVLRDHRRVVRRVFGDRGGVEVDTQGDSFFYAFSRATDAVSAAGETQAALTDAPVRIRIGVHTGEASLGDEGYVGIDVHRAARICAAAHGGQVLVSAATARLVDVDLHDLGAHRLKDLFAPMRLYQLGHAEFPPLRTLNFTNLPIQQTALVGRERELEEAADLLRRNRLVTLVGAGGTGKTRLAVQVAADVADDFTDGVFWVPLAAVADPELVEPAIAQAVGVTSELANQLVSKRVLFCVDNFEQVVDAAPRLARLLDATSDVKFLVTSREPLRLAAEWEYPVASMRHGDAVALFAERARTLDPAFEPDNAVDEICRSLDGLPLAIELAAARVKVLSTAEILERLDHRLSLLTSGTRDAPLRHQTLRATIDWSYTLLRPEERELFARLAIFAGGWTLPAAEAVCGAGLDTLEGLVSKNLVTHTRDRFGMLAMIREYANESLETVGARDAMARGHAEFFLALAERIRPEVERGEREAWERAGDDDANIRLALEHFSQTGQADLELRLAAALWQFWFTQGRWEETLRLLRRALENSSLEGVARVRALYGAAWITGRMGKPGHATDLADEAVRLARGVGDNQLIGQMLRVRAVIEAWRPDKDPARRDALSAEARQFSEAAGDAGGIAATLNNEAIELREAGDYRGAVELSRQAVELNRQDGNRRLLVGALGHLADAERLLGEPVSALSHLAEALLLARDLGFRERVVEAIQFAACISASAGDQGWTAALLGAAQREASFGWVVESAALAAEFEEARTSARIALGDERFSKIVAAGRAMPLDDVADSLASGAGVLTVPVDTDTALAALRGLTSIRLSEFAVVGSYMRFDETTRQDLIDVRQSIEVGLTNPGHKRNAHLLWAAPGSGKTYFVQQVAASLPGITYRELNLAKADERGLRDFLDEVGASDAARTLCFIDECDAKPSEPWPYEQMLPAMDAAAANGAPVVFVLAGSSGANAAEMQERITSRPKGADLLSRIPRDNVHTVDPLDINDRILVATRQLRDAAIESGHDVSAVEKMALFYICVESRLGSPRQLHEVCVRAVERLLPGETRLRYDHLFSPGNPENKAFWLQWQVHHRALVSHFVAVDD